MTRVHHPAPATIGAHLQHVARILQTETRHDPRKTHCTCITCQATRLAEHGYPPSTSRDGRGSNSELTAVEAAATTKPPFPGLDDTLAKALRTLWATARIVEDKIALIRRHGSDTEQVAGLGHCVACEHFANPRTNPNDRLRSGLCNACDQAWRRWLRDNPNGLRPDFIRTRRNTLRQPA